MPEVKEQYTVHHVQDLFGQDKYLVAKQRPTKSGVSFTVEWLSEEEAQEVCDILNSRPSVGEKCEWKESSDMEMSGTYETTCGQMFTLSNEEGPTKNGFKFCTYCGKELIEVPRPQEIDED